MSIDDGHPLDLQMAELLDRHGLQATFYVPIENCEGLPVLEPAHIRVLAQRFELGSHTRSHRFLTSLSAHDAWHQISEGKQQLEDCVGGPIRGFCYPGGYYRRIHVLQVRAAGFDYARTTQNLRFDVGSRSFEMPTSMQFYPHPASVFLRNFVSQRDWLRRGPALRVAIAEKDWLTRLHRLLDLAMAHRGIFHLWCHSVDIERLQLWNALDGFLRRVSEAFDEAACVGNGELLSHLSPPAAMAAHVQTPDQPDDDD